MNNDVEVKFGGDISDLKRKSAEAKAELGGFQGVGNSLGKVFQEVGGHFSNMFSNKQGINEAKEGFTSLNGVAGQAKTILGGVAESAGVVGIAIAAVGAITYEVAHKLMEFGEKMGDISLKIEQQSQKLGINVQQMQELNAVSLMVNMGQDAMVGGLTRLERAMVLAENGGKRQQAVFNNLQIDLTKVKDPMEALLLIADRFKDMDNGPKKVTLAMTLMGRAGAQMIPVLNQGREALEKMFKEAEERGAVMSKALVEQGIAIHESQDKVKLSTMGLRNAMFESLAPAIKGVTDMWGGCIQAMVESYRTGGLVKTIIEAIAFACKTLIFALNVLGNTFRVVFYAMYLAVVPVIDVIAGLGRALWDLAHGEFTKAGKDAWKGFTEGAQDGAKAVKGAHGALMSIDRSFKTLWGKGSGKHGPESGDPDMDLAIPGFGPNAKKKPKDKTDDSEMQAWIEQQEFKKDLARDNWDQLIALEEEKIAKIAEYYGTDSKEYGRVLREKVKMTREHNQEMAQEDLTAIKDGEQNQESGMQAWKQIELTKIADKRAHLEEEAAAGRISDVTKLKGLETLLVQERRLEENFEEALHTLRMADLQDELNIQNLRPQERKRILEEIKKEEERNHDAMTVMNAQFNEKMNRADAALATKIAQRWKSALEPVSQAFQNIFQNMVWHTQSWASLFVQILQGLTATFLKKGADMVVNWIVNEHVKTAATQAGVAARTAVTMAGAAQTSAISATSAIHEITSNAAVGGSGAFAAIAKIPYIGPFIAPAIAAAVMIAIMGFGSKIASARGGFDVPSGVNPLTQLHEEEMVLPSSIANPFRAFLGGFSPRGSGMGGMSAAAGEAGRTDAALRGSGGPIHIHAMDARSFEDFLKRNRGVLGKVAASAFRDRVGA